MQIKKVTILNEKVLSGDYNFKIVYDLKGTRYFITNKNSVSLDRTMDKMKEVLAEVKESGATLIEVKLLAVV